MMKTAVACESCERPLKDDGDLVYRIRITKDLPSGELKLPLPTACYIGEEYDVCRECYERVIGEIRRK